MAKNTKNANGKANGTAPKALREGSAVARLVALILNKPMDADAIVKALKTEKNLGKRTTKAYVSGFRGGLKNAGFTLKSTEKGWIVAKA